MVIVTAGVGVPVAAVEAAFALERTGCVLEAFDDTLLIRFPAGRYVDANVVAAAMVWESSILLLTKYGASDRAARPQPHNGGTRPCSTR
jgi:hypothetical protein